MPDIQALYLEEIREYPWLSRVGEPVPSNLPFSARQVTTLVRGIDTLCSPEWESFTLAARNRLTVDLHQRARDKYNLWNQYTEEAKSKLVTPLADTIWRPKVASLGLSEIVVDDLQWNVLAAVMEHAYRKETRIDPFFKRLLVVYQTGHLPCGWAGDWPSGNLLVV